MQTEWTIDGELGQGWDNIQRTLEYRKINSARIAFNSLEPDELTFNIVVEDLATEVFTATPTFSPDSSVQIGATVAVTVTCATPGAVIRYTTDGSDPTPSSIQIIANGGTLTVANPSTLKAMAIAPGMLASDIKVAQYVVEGVIATGGTVSDAGGFRTHVFQESGSFVVTNPGTVEYLVVGGGGSGGQNSSSRSGGGGGAGGFRTASGLSLAAGTYAITVGAGGMAQLVQNSASDGGNSSIGSTIVSTGGGAGASVAGTTAVSGRSGGSGGGSVGNIVAGTGIVGQGFAGGRSASTNSGTGGGASAAGVAVETNTLNGGAGTASSITGTSITYAVGGGIRTDPDASVIPNTGRGGAGRRLGSAVGLGANGSPGIVVIRYALVQPPAPANIPSTASNLPTLRQEMGLYRDGARFFHGNVTNIRSVITADSHEHQVTVSGPWWFLEKVPFTTNIQDGVGTSAERLSAVFGTPTAGQNLQTSIESAINRAASIGCPIATILGGSSVAAMHAFPRITLNQSTCGQAIAELVRLVPDAMVRFDYAYKPARMHVVRRPSCPTTSFDENTAPITSIDVNPVIELQVQQVSLPALTRDTTGATRFNSQASGNVPTGKNITKRQVLTIAGPELDTFLPNDLFDVQTVTTSRSFSQIVHDQDAQCVNSAFINGFGRIPINISVLTTRLVSASGNGALAGFQIFDFTVGGFTIFNKSNQRLDGFGLLTSGQPADWTGISYQECTVSGQMWIEVLSSSNKKFLTDAGFQMFIRGFTSTTTGSPLVEYWTKPFGFSGYATSGATASSTIYKPADYSFINPPAGLADFLRSTQDWLPYEGEIVLEQEDVGTTRYAGTKVNIINSLPSFSTMGALVSSETLEIESGRTTIRLGAPPRNDYRTLVDKIRKTSQDNIVYI